MCGEFYPGNGIVPPRDSARCINAVHLYELFASQILITLIFHRPVADDNLLFPCNNAILAVQVRLARRLHEDQTSKRSKQ